MATIPTDQNNVEGRASRANCSVEGCPPASATPHRDGLQLLVEAEEWRRYWWGGIRRTTAVTAGLSSSRSLIYSAIGGLSELLRNGVLLLQSPVIRELYPAI